MLKLKWIGIAIVLLVGVIILQWHIDNLLLSLIFGMTSGFCIGITCMVCYLNEDRDKWIN